MSNINENMMKLGKVRSVIRETFEYGNARAAQIGSDNVFDFSLGNPSVPAPSCFDDALINLIENYDSVSLHGYTSAQGDANTRSAIAENINKRFNANVDKNDIYITCGAAASLAISINALACKGDEIIVFAPFFPEYRVFVENSGAKMVVVPADIDNFQIDFKAFEALVNKNTKAVIINSPNNPTGVVYSKNTIERLCNILKNKSNEYASPIYLISDEPYREIVFDDIELPYITNCYDNSIVCYSFSKSLSLPGERIGYIVVGNRMQFKSDVYAAICGSGRALGYVCAPSMMQKAIVNCLGTTSDINVYKTNRDLLYNALSDYGYNCVKPDGAFYLFAKAPISDANEFCLKAREYELLLVPSDSFGCSGYVRISYCVSTDMIKRALPAFKKLIDNYR